MARKAPLVLLTVMTFMSSGLGGLARAQTPEPLTIEVAIDIKPGAFPNSLNINGHGVIPVAVLGSESFDVTQIDTTTLDFAGLDVKRNKNSKAHCSFDDVSGDFATPAGAPDGYMDVACKFVDDPDGWKPDVGTATLTGLLLPGYGGTAFSGSDEYRRVPVGRAPFPLVVWVDGPMAAALAETADRFTIDTGVPVVLEVIPKAELAGRLLAAAEAGIGPDIFVGEHAATDDFVEAGLAEPIDLTSVASEFHPIAIQSSLYEGERWGLPFALEAIAMVYNRDLVPAPPSMFEQLGPSCAAMTGIENCVGLHESDLYHHYPLLSAFGGYVFRFDPAFGYDPSDVGLDSPGAIAGAQYLESQVQAGVIGLTGGYQETMDLFLAGVQPYWVAGPWVLPTLAASTVDWGVVPIPTMDGSAPRPFVGVTGFFRGAYGAQEADAEFLLDYVATTESMVAFIEMTPKYLSAHLAAYAALADDVTSAFMESATAGEPEPNVAEMGYVWQPVNDALDGIRTGALQAEEAIIQAAQAVRDAIGRR